MTEYLQVTTAAANRQTAVELARSAVQARLAAGAQVAGPVVSVFWHHGEFGEGEEWLVVLKTTATRYAELEAHLITHHKWQKPEVTAVPLAAGSADYLDWVGRATTLVSEA